MRVRGRKYVYTAEECIDALLASDFADLPPRDQMLRDIELPKPYCNGQEVTFLHIDGDIIDCGLSYAVDGSIASSATLRAAEKRGGKIVRVMYYDRCDVFAWARSKYGGRCMACRQHFHIPPYSDLGFTIRKNIGSVVEKFLEEIRPAREKGMGMPPPPLCGSCSASFARYADKNLRGIKLTKKAHKDMLEMLYIQWAGIQMDFRARKKIRQEAGGSDASSQAEAMHREG